MANQISNDTILLTANAGVLICYHGKKILVDAMHDRKTKLFSRVPDDILKKVANGEGDFENIDLVLYTHDHPDHYSKGWTMRLLDRQPGITMVSPISDFTDRSGVHLLTKQKETFSFEGIHLTCKRLQHDGSEFAGIVHYGYMIELDGFHILIPGDGVMEGRAMESFLDGFQADLALLNFPYFTLKRNRQVLCNVLSPKRFILYHLPYYEDDINGYLLTTQKMLQKDIEDYPDAAILFDRMQKEPI